MVKTTTLKTLKVKVKKDGTLTEKSLKEIQAFDKPGVAEKFLSPAAIKQYRDTGGLLGLTVGVRYGIISPLSFFLGEDWFPGKNIEAAVESAEQTIREVFDNQWTKREKLLLRNILQINKDLRSTKLTEGQREQLELIRAAMEAEITGIPAEGSEERATEFQKWLEENRGFIEWLTSLGIAHLAIKLAESHTVSDLGELLPGQ